MNHQGPRTSELLLGLVSAYGGRDRVAVGDLVRALRNRAFGITLLLFGIPNCLPMPPGIPVVCGIVLILAALPMIAGRDEMWLPRRIEAKTIAVADLKRMVDRAVPWIIRLERLSRPRLAMFSDPQARRVVGALVAFLGFVLILPIPFLGNMPPGVAVCIFGLGLIERDGLIILIGFGATIAAAAITAGMTWMIVAGVGWLF